MASQLVSVRFPSGETEFRITAEPPRVGDMLTRGDVEWLVQEIGTDENGRAVVTLVPVVRDVGEFDASAAGIPRESRG
jgi:hypothetical protein